jgi:hypothetical protein
MKLIIPAVFLISVLAVAGVLAAGKDAVPVPAGQVSGLRNVCCKISGMDRNRTL